MHTADHDIWAAWQQTLNMTVRALLLCDATKTQLTDADPRHLSVSQQRRLMARARKELQRLGVEPPL